MFMQKFLKFTLIILFFSFSYMLASSNKDIYYKDWIDFNKNNKKDIYEDPIRSHDERADNLVSQMSLEEKAAQLATLYGYGAVLQDRLPSEAWKDSIWRFGLANIDEQLSGHRKDTLYAYPYSSHANALNVIQKWFIEETRLGIPVDFTIEGIRGLNHHKATYFPAQIAQSCSFNQELIYNIGRVTAQEAKVLGYTNIYSPILDVASDPRWGRIEETYGSDPYLVSRLGLQNIKAIQSYGLVSTPKHFAVYSIPAGGRDGDARVNPHVAPREMWEVYLEPFRVAFQEGKAKGTMASYNDYDGIPVIGSYQFLTEILREKFGFDGYVVSDSHAFEDLFTKHMVVKDTTEAAALALSAGMNVRTDFTSPTPYIKGIINAVNRNLLPINILNQRVKEVIKVKLWLGLFDNPYVKDIYEADKVVGSKEAKELALEAALKGIVLLKNNDNLLPLNKNKVKSLAIIGPNAKEKESLLSRYGPVNISINSVYDGISQYVNPNTKIYYAKGCEHIDKNFPRSDIQTFDMTNEENLLIEEAVEVAKKAEIVILVVGDNEKTVGEFYSRSNLDLPGRQLELVKRISRLNKPTVLIHVGGRPVTFNFENENLSSILETWYLGEFHGEAVAKTLFGEYNPSGKLSVAFPKHVGQLPLSFPLKPASDGRGGAHVSGFLYPFGFGLSYTSYSYSDLSIDMAKWKSNSQIEVSFRVKNTGTRKGDEIVQLYIRDEISSVITYLKKLRAFGRVSLEPREEKTVTLRLDREDFYLYNKNMERVLEPGSFNVMIGASSEDIRLQQRIIIN